MSQKHSTFLLVMIFGTGTPNFIVIIQLTKKIILHILSPLKSDSISIDSIEGSCSISPRVHNHWGCSRCNVLNIPLNQSFDNSKSLQNIAKANQK
jgi:hypothetical protein